MPVPEKLNRMADQIKIIECPRDAWQGLAKIIPTDVKVVYLRKLIELGFRHLVFHAPGPDQPRFLKLYAEQVLPRLRKAFG